MVTAPEAAPAWGWLTGAARHAARRRGLFAHQPKAEMGLGRAGRKQHGAGDYRRASDAHVRISFVMSYCGFSPCASNLSRDRRCANPIPKVQVGRGSVWADVLQVSIRRDRLERQDIALWG